MISPQPDSTPRHRLGNGTFSIVGMDPETREWGIAVASRILDSGYVVIWLKPEIGAVATQGQVNAHLGPLAMDLISSGRTAEDFRQAIHFEEEALKRKPGNEFFRQQLIRFGKDNGAGCDAEGKRKR